MRLPSLTHGLNTGRLQYELPLRSFPACRDELAIDFVFIRRLTSMNRDCIPLIQAKAVPSKPSRRQPHPYARFVYGGHVLAYEFAEIPRTPRYLLRCHHRYGLLELCSSQHNISGQGGYEYNTSEVRAFVWTLFTPSVRCPHSIPVIRFSSSFS